MVEDVERVCTWRLIDEGLKAGIEGIVSSEDSTNAREYRGLYICPNARC